MCNRLSVFVLPRIGFGVNTGRIVGFKEGFMKFKKLVAYLFLAFALFVLWSFMLSRTRVFEKRGVIDSNGQSNTTTDWVTPHADPLRMSSKRVEVLDPRCRELKNFEKSVTFLIHTEDLIREISKTQSNVRNEAKAIGRLLFLDDWAVLRLKYPKLPKNLGETLYNSVMESFGASNKIEVVDWISSQLQDVSLEEVLQSQSAEAAVAMNRHYQWIIEDGRRPALMEVLRELGGEFESSALFGSPMLMDLWGYGFLKTEAQDWENQRLDTSLPAKFSRTAEERALFSQPSPNLVQAAAEERRWSQSLHQKMFAWRLSNLYGVKDPDRILEIVDKIRFNDAHHFGWPDP